MGTHSLEVIGKISGITSHKSMILKGEWILKIYFKQLHYVWNVHAFRLEQDLSSGRNMNSRILVVTGSADSASQYMSYMNVFFTAQKQVSRTLLLRVECIQEYTRLPVIMEPWYIHSVTGYPPVLVLCNFLYQYGSWWLCNKNIMVAWCILVSLCEWFCFLLHRMWPLMCAAWSKTWVSCSKGVTLLVGCIFAFHSFKGCYSTCWYVTTVLLYGSFPFTGCVNESFLPFTCFSFITAPQILVKFCIIGPIKSFGRILLSCMLGSSNPCFPCNLKLDIIEFLEKQFIGREIIFSVFPEFPPNFVSLCVWHLCWAPCFSLIFLLCFFLSVSYSEPSGIST